MASGNPTPLWDAHVHLPAYPDPSAPVGLAKAMGIRLMSATVSPKEAAQNLAFRKRDPSTVKCFIGVHPSEAEAADPRLEELSPLWESADGVGEVGLDPKYSEVSAKGAQMAVFRVQVEVASRLNKPLQVHSRGAERACLDLIDGYPLRSVLMHWFEGEDLVDRVVSRRGRFVSFGPALLYSKKLQRIARLLPEDAVLTESDGPVAFGALGGAGGPGLIPSVAFKLAELWGRGFEEATGQLAINAESFLG